MGSEACMKRFVCAAFLTLTAISYAAAQKPERPVLVVSSTSDKVSYSPQDSVQLNFSLENRGSAIFYVYRTLEWGWAGLRFRFTDAGGNILPSPWLGRPPIPPPVYDKSQLVGLEPGYFFGTHLSFPLSRFNLKPGTYYLEVAYQSNYPKEEGFGLPILTSDDGVYLSNKVEIDVRPK